MTWRQPAGLRLRLGIDTEATLKVLVLKYKYSVAHQR